MKKFLIISLVVCLVLVTYLSLRAGDGKSTLPVNDKVGHMIAYFVLMVNAGLLISMKHFPRPALMLLLYGAFIEYLQGMVPGRTSSYQDLIANSFGICLGWAFLLIFGTRVIRLLRKFGLTS